ncbi:MAG: autotransporter outer membrane beta-barrel domain-containing protein, partial [Thermomonas sp.]
GLADGIFASGADVEVSNSGSIEVSGYTWAAGIEAQGTGTTSVGNDGDIYAVSMDATPAFGIYATGDVVTVVNTGLGNIEAQGYYATGIEAQGGSSVTVTNDGDIVAGSITTYYDPNTYTTSVYGSTLATGINATVNYAGGMVTVINNGSVSGVGYYGGTGIAATASGANGSASVTNSGSIYASQYTKYGYGAYGIVASADGNATISNTSTSSITVNSAGAASGASALSFTGNANVTNAGDITVESTSILNYTASGIVAFAQNGAAYAGNSGSVSAVAGYTAKAVDASGFTSATVVNSGSLYANAKYAYGVYASSGTGDVSVTNTAAGSIEAYSYAGRGFGVLGIATQGDVMVDNAGSIEVYGFGQSAGVFGVALEGDTNLTNSGDISVISGGDAAIGMFARADQGTASVNNSGDIVASDDAVNDGYVGYAAYGIVTRGAFGNVTNSGSIIADGNYYATGIAARSDDGTTVVTTASSQIAASASLVAIGIEGRSEYGNVSVTNGGHVTATSPDTAVGIFASAFGDVTINNSGVVMAVADGNDASVAAVQMESLDGQSTLNNAGTGSISVQGTEGYAFAVVGSDAVDIINNSGLITGAVTLYGGDDVFNNRSGGVWNVGTTYSTDFGDGDDTINNLAGGTIRFDSGAIYLGSSVDGNAFNNTGIIKVNGDSLIGMGTGTGGGVPTLVPSLNPLPLVNNGVIDMVDGVADDSLTIVGDLGGNGSLNIDVMVPNGPSDELHVDGSMVAGAVQTVNAYFHPSLLLAAQSGHFEKFAFVTGNSTAASFVGGQVIGYDPNNFLDLDVVVTSQINAANTADDVFSVGVDVVGLNDTGSLAASIASGAAGMLNAQVGTFKQRMGVNPYGDAGKVMSAFFRTYTSEGDVNPTHAMSNFGQGGHFDYDQSVWGREVGVNANLYGNFHAGVVLGSADGRQRLTGDGVGQNRMDGMTWGMYATWLVPNGFYVDLSGRWMAVDVRSTSVAGTLTTRAHTGAWNLEAGYEWMLGGLSVVPQLQYTRTTVDEVRPIYGTAATFESHDGTSSRGRVGVEVSKTFESGGIRWTPYGSINAIREFDGDMNYTVANVFQGGTSVQGTSTMAELGLGVQKGDWGFTIGANWIDGGAYKSTVGGQALVRFAW